MRVVIVGAGDVGYDVARMLSLQRHDVAVVDSDAAKIEQIRDKLDVLAVLGSGTSAAALLQAGVREADLLVAVTNVDEVNLIACMMAERVGRKPTTIARVRSDEFTGQQAVLTMKDFGIDLLIHPEDSTASEVLSLLRRASATDVLPFADGRLQLVGVRLDPGSSVIGVSLGELASRFGHLTYRIMGISRGIRTIVPSGGERLQKGDQVFVLVETGQVPQAIHMLGKSGVRLEHIMILGGTRVGARIAARLSQESRFKIKLVEADRKRAEMLAEELERVLVIHGSPSDIDLLAVEGLGEMDAVVAVTDDEESNLVSCLMAKHLRVRKTVALLSKSAYIPISQSIGLDAAVSQKLAVTREVMRFLRGKHVASLATVYGLDAEVVELVAAPGSAITMHPLTDQRLPKGVLIGAVVGQKIEIATGQTRIREGDHAIVFCAPNRVGEVTALFGRGADG
jgi:trk system potassium uptake protein